MSTNKILPSSSLAKLDPHSTYTKSTHKANNHQNKQLTQLQRMRLASGNSEGRAKFQKGPGEIAASEFYDMDSLREAQQRWGDQYQRWAQRQNLEGNTNEPMPEPPNVEDFRL